MISAEPVTRVNLNSRVMAQLDQLKVGVIVYPSLSWAVLSSLCVLCDPVFTLVAFIFLIRGKHGVPRTRTTVGDAL
jgi:hypothetical protein